MYTGNQQGREGNRDSNKQFGTKGRNKHSKGTEWRNKNTKSEERIRNFWDNFKCSNIQIIGLPEGEVEEPEIQKHNERKLPQSGEGNTQTSPGTSDNPKQARPTEEHTKHIIIKLHKTKDKERILKASREKGTVSYKEVPIRLSADFSKETLHPWLLYPAKLPFRMEGQIKCFPDKVKLKEFIITKPLFYEMLKGLKKKVKTMNSKMTTSSQPSKTEPKQNKTKTKQELHKWLKQEQNNRNGNHMESYQCGRGEGRMQEKVQRIRSIIVSKK